MDAELEELLRRAKAKVDAMSPSEREQMHREQRESWVRGEMGISETSVMKKPTTPADAAAKALDAIVAKWTRHNGFTLFKEVREELIAAIVELLAEAEQKLEHEQERHAHTEKDACLWAGKADEYLMRAVKAEAALAALLAEAERPKPSASSEEIIRAMGEAYAVNGGIAVLDIAEPEIRRLHAALAAAEQQRLRDVEQGREDERKRWQDSHRAFMEARNNG